MTAFSPAQLKSIVETTLAVVPDGHTNAIVGGLDQHGAQVVASFKLGADDRWVASGVARHDWTGNNTVGASLVYSW